MSVPDMMMGYVPSVDYFYPMLICQLTFRLHFFFFRYVASLSLDHHHHHWHHHHEHDGVWRDLHGLVVVAQSSRGKPKFRARCVCACMPTYRCKPRMHAKVLSVHLLLYATLVICSIDLFAAWH